MYFNSYADLHLMAPLWNSLFIELMNMDSISMFKTALESEKKIVVIISTHAVTLLLASYNYVYVYLTFGVLMLENLCVGTSSIHF